MLSRRPNSAMLWIGLGNALVVHADGQVTPPARYAFVHAAELAPDRPAAGYFLALAYAQAGDLDHAEPIWRTLLRAAPADAPWRQVVADRLATVARLRHAPAAP